MANEWVGVAGLLSIVVVGFASSARSAPERISHTAQASATELSSLETACARHPNDEGKLRQLAQGYLDRGAPGAALAALGRASSLVDMSPALAELASQANLDAGHASASARSAGAALDRCATAPCDREAVSILRRSEALAAAFVSSGIEDPSADREAARRIAHRALRQVRIATTDEGR